VTYDICQSTASGGVVEFVYFLIIPVYYIYSNTIKLDEREKKKRGNGLSWTMRRNREALEICGSAIAHLSVPHTLRR
jgi:hypothetical protein